MYIYNIYVVRVLLWRQLHYFRTEHYQSCTGANKKKQVWATVCSVTFIIITVLLTIWLLGYYYSSCSELLYSW